MQREFRLDRTLFKTGLCAIIAILALNALTINRQLPWQDEVFVTSTAWSMAHSDAPKLSVLAQYPQSRSPIEFYGPLSFQAALALVRLFGLSPAPWRLVCLAGVALTAFAGARLVRVAGGDRWAQLLAALLLTLVGTISRFLPGRWDYVTTGFFFLALVPLLRITQTEKPAPIGHLILGGLSLGMALASTPRTLPLISSALAALIVTALVFRTLVKPLWWGGAVTLATAVAVQTAILLPWGMNTFSWYQQVRSIARKDHWDVTPITGGGYWNFDLEHHKVTLTVLVALMFIAAFGILSAKRGKPDRVSIAPRLFLGLLALLNLLQMLAFLGRPFSRPEFMLPPAIIAAMCWFFWKGHNPKRLNRWAVVAAGAAVVVLLVQDLQLGASVVLSWHRRDPAALVSFVRRAVPQGSVVYGPVGGYFYAVELAGSKYLYTYEETLEGLKSEPDASLGNKLDSEICGNSVYVVWPEADPRYYPEMPALPPAVTARLLPGSARFQEPDVAPPSHYVLQRLGFTANKYGYANTAIYKLRSVRGCSQVSGLALPR